MESIVLVLDIRRSAGNSIPFLRRACSTFVHDKLVNKPSHNLGVVCFGSERPINERVGEGGDNGLDDKFDNVSVLHPLEVAGIETLRGVTALASSSSDEGRLSGALQIAVDMLASVKGKSGKKRIVVLSSFDNIDEGDMDEVRATVQSAGKRPGATITFVHYDHLREYHPFHDKKPWIWDRVVSHAKDFTQLKVVRTPGQLATCFPVKESKDVHVIYSGPLVLARGIEVLVKISPKIKKEPFMGLGNSNISDTNEDGSHPVPFSGSALSCCYRMDDIEQESPLPLQKG
jgi:hypothetical protein